MRVLIDTNVLISAALSAGGTPFQAYVKAASFPNSVMPGLIRTAQIPLPLLPSPPLPHT